MTVEFFIYLFTYLINFGLQLIGMKLLWKSSMKLWKRVKQLLHTLNFLLLEIS